MRVEGNVIPEDVHVEAYGPCPGMAEIRIRENAAKDEETGLYFYDEYVFRLPGRPGLEAEIRKDLPRWLATGRAREAGEKTSLAAELRQALDMAIPGEKQGRELKMAREFRQETKEGLQLIYDTLSPVQRLNLMKQEKAAMLLRRYGIGEGL